MLRQTLQEREVEFDRVRTGTYVASLPGTHKLKTNVMLSVGDHSLRVEAFFVRHPDENHDEFYRFLLQRNAKMYAVSYAVDHLGDVYLVGHLPLSAVTPDEIDRILGCVLEYSDDYFDKVLELGFASAIRKEWDWRTKRGESTRNLEAFRHLFEPTTS